MLLVWVLMCILFVILDILLVRIFGTCISVGAFFALLAMNAGYSISAQIAVFTVLSVCMFLSIGKYFYIMQNKFEKKQNRNDFILRVYP